jgi:hypothetical protein
LTNLRPDTIICVVNITERSGIGQTPGNDKRITANISARACAARRRLTRVEVLHRKVKLSQGPDTHRHTAKIDRSAEASQECHFLYVHLKGRVTNQQRKLLTKHPAVAATLPVWH